MKQYSLKKSDLLISKTLTTGTQDKYMRNGYFYKINKVGNEGFVEFLVSELLKSADFWNCETDFVRYEYCIINSRKGCRSKSFVENGEEFITMSSMYRMVTGGKNLVDKIMLIDTNKRLDYVVGIAVEFGVNRSEFITYLNTLVQLDMLIENTDRHEHNYGVIRDKKVELNRL